MKRITALLALAAAPALAQEAIVLPEQPPPEPPQSVAPAEVEEIIVTATKRERPLSELPASIRAFGPQELREMGAVRMQDLLDLVPGVATTEYQPELFRISIRGLQTDASAVTPHTTAVIIDDVPFNDPFIAQVRPDLPLFDLAGVEVLKGPQGTLFGGSALSGALRYRLAEPEPGAWDAAAFHQYQQVRKGSPNSLAGGMVNLPLGNGALRVTAVGRQHGGVIDDLRNGMADTDELDSHHLRGLARFDIGERFSLRIKAMRQSTDAKDVSATENTEGRLERDRALRVSPTLTEYRLYGLDAEFAMSWARLISSTSRLEKIADISNDNGARSLGTEASGIPAALPFQADIAGLVQEIRLVSPDATTWQWVAGLYAHDYESYSFQQTFIEDPLGSPSLLDFTADIEARELAAFGDVSRRFGPHWELSLGLRAYDIKTGGVVASSGAIILATGDTENRNETAIDASGLNPRFALAFRPRKGLNLYLSAARGFRFGGIQIVGPSPSSPDVPETYSPDSLWSFELGLRSQWLDGRIRADAALYRIDWNKPQVQSRTSGAVPLNVIDNIDSARSEGGELSLSWRTPLPGLTATLSHAWTDAYTTAPFTAHSGDEIPAGSRLPGYADRQLVASLRLARAMGRHQFSALLTHRRHGEGVSDILQSMQIYDYHATDLRLALESPGWPGAPRLSLGVVNLGDERGILSAFVISDTNFTTTYNQPRSLDLRLDLSF